MNPDLPVGALARALYKEPHYCDSAMLNCAAAILPALHADPEYRAWLTGRVVSLAFYGETDTPMTPAEYADAILGRTTE